MSGTVARCRRRPPIGAEIACLFDDGTVAWQARVLGWVRDDLMRAELTYVNKERGVVGRLGQVAAVLWDLSLGMVWLREVAE